MVPLKIDLCSFAGFESLNGSNLRFFHLTNELKKRGFDLRFVVPSKKHADNCNDRFGIEAKDVGLEIDRFDRKRLKLYPKFAWKAGRVLGSCDAVFGQSLPSALAVRLCKTKGKKMVDYVDIWSEYWRYAHRSLKARAIYRALRLAERYTMKVDTIFTITREIQRMIEERGGKPEKVRIVRDGVDTKMFRKFRVKDAFLEKYGLDRKTEYVTYQGGIGAWDGVQFMAQSAPLVLKKNPGVRFLIVGDGEYAPAVKEAVRKAGVEDSFIFTGWVPYEEMPSFMNVSRLNVVPIPDAPCTRGVVTLKLFEAIACGVPTVIGDLPGVKEHMEHGKNAYLVRSEVKESLALGINDMLSDRKLYERMSKNGLSIIDHYDWREIAKDMADIIEGAS